jgi:hypothetical protein
VFDLAGITGIMKTPGGFVGETVAAVQFTEHQPPASEVIRPSSKSATTSLFSWLVVIPKGAGAFNGRLPSQAA